MPMFKLLSRQTFKERDIHQYDEYLIQLQNVIKTYQTEAGDFFALNNIKLEIGNGPLKERLTSPAHRYIL